jgi:hypothetical protein
MSRAPVYTIQLYVGTVVHGSGVVGPVVPAGFVYVLRDVDMQESSGTVGANFSIRNGAGGLLWQKTLVAGDVDASFAWRGRQAYSAGQQIGFRGFSGSWYVAATGYALTV